VEVLGLAADLATADGNRRLVETAIEVMGAVDLFCANAGIGSGQGPEAADEVWERVWRINTMAHVWAVRALLPGWLSAGSGYLLVTASAAGLLTNLGDAPYSVSKAGAVAFADWMAVTYGRSTPTEPGIGVSCLCPQGVRTPLLFPEGADNVLATEVVKAQRIIEPSQVADAVVEGLADERFLILPHAEVEGYVLAKATDRGRWLRSMRKLQAMLVGGAGPSEGRR
jgi:NAD(P)-dependent dehydrogenase (short-subunit alcohol dehydrogenase family)